MSAKEVDYEEVFEVLPIPVVLIDGEGRIEQVNRAFVDFSRSSGLVGVGEDWSGGLLVDCIGGEQGGPIKEIVEEVLAEGSAGPVEVAFGVPEQWMEIRAGMRKHGAGACILWRDVTMEKKQAAALQHMQKLEVFSQVGSGVAHDINNALSLVNGYAELVLGDDLSLDVRASIETVLNSGRRCGDIADRLLRYARWLRAGRRAEDLNAIVANAVDMMRRQFEKDKVVLTEDLGDHLPEVEVHAGQIQVILFNLLQNSREVLLRDGGDGIVQVRTYVRDPWVVLEVEDDGSGLATELRERIFEASFSAKEGGAGEGLALGICREIARAHGGQMRLCGEPPEVCMALELPPVEQINPRVRAAL